MCLARLQATCWWAESLELKALDTSLRSVYTPKPTIQQLIDQMIIEEWRSSVIDDTYYNECQPVQCTSSYQTRNDTIYIITTLVGLVGGVVTVLKIAIPRLVSVCQRFVFSRERVQPQVPTGAYNDQQRRCPRYSEHGSANSL